MRKNARKKKILMGLSAILGLALFCGCSSSQGQPKATPEPYITDSGFNTRTQALPQTVKVSSIGCDATFTGDWLVSETFDTTFAQNISDFDVEAVAVFSYTKNFKKKDLPQDVLEHDFSQSDTDKKADTNTVNEPVSLDDLKIPETFRENIQQQKDYAENESFVSAAELDYEKMANFIEKSLHDVLSDAIFEKMNVFSFEFVGETSIGGQPSFEVTANITAASGNKYAVNGYCFANKMENPEDEIPCGVFLVKKISDVNNKDYKISDEGTAFLNASFKELISSIQF